MTAWAWRSVGSVLCWVAVVPWALWAAVRVFGWERGPLVQLMAFTPYAALGALVSLAIALPARRWWAAGLAGLAVLSLTAAVLPRAIASDRVPGDDRRPVVRVLTANLRAGSVDPSTVMSLVRTHDADVLALQELTPDARGGLRRAGLTDELPHAMAHPLPGVAGSALYSRFPLRDGGVRTNPGGFTQAYATVLVPGAEAVLAESVHPCPR